MRREDHDRLSEPYSAEDELRPDDRLPLRLGVFVESTKDLHSAIFEDLDERVYGIGWWAPHLGTARRILISDYVLQVTRSIQVNLTEAELHRLYAMGAWEVERRQSAAFITQGPHRAKSALDDLDSAMADLHVAGFFRALASTIDCLGGAIVAVAGLKTNLLRADWRKALKALERAREGNETLAALHERLQALEANGGPAGWLRWVTSYRNMLVHRGRRTTMKWMGDPMVIYGPRGEEYPRVESALILARDPEHTDCEILRHNIHGSLLEEPADTTVREVLYGVRDLVDATCTELLDLWERRRADPELLLQPSEQWPEVREPLNAFRGYTPGAVEITFDGLVASPDMTRRVRAAALDPEHRPEWDTFD